VRALLLVALLLSIAPAFAQSTDEPVREPAVEAPTQESIAPEIAATEGVEPDIAVLDQVLVTGEQTGPGLWKVTNNGNTLWILGTHDPLPKKITWRSREVESIIAESQRVVRWVEIDTDVDIGFFAGLSALPLVFTVGNNPDGAKLKDLVSPEAYEQWQVLKTKYVGRGNDMEKLRPAFAALELRSKATGEAGLSSKPIIWPAVERLAKRHKVKIVEPKVAMEIKIDKPRAMIKKFRKTQLADVECFTHSIARLEGDIEAMKLRANAWAIGELDVLRQIPPPDPSSDCGQMLQNVFLNGNLADELGAREMMDRTLAEMTRVMKEQDATWLRTVEDALRDHTSILAVVPINKLFGAQSLLQPLRDRGYEVDEPSAAL
jgi:hypothetical protein